MIRVYEYEASNCEALYPSEASAVEAAIEAWRASAVQCRADITITEWIGGEPVAAVARVTSDLQSTVTVTSLRTVAAAPAPAVPGTLAHARRTKGEV